MYDVAHLGSEGELAAGTPAPVMATWILGFNHNNNKLSSFSVMILALLAQSQVLKITSSQFTFFIKNWNVSNIWEFPQLQPMLNSQQEEVLL